MSLWLGNHSGENVADLIASIANESEILQILDQYVEPEIGRVELAVNAASTGDLSQIPILQTITTKAQAIQVKSGWVYTNGAWVSKTFFPKAFDVLAAAGLPTDGTNVQLPRLNGFAYAASTLGSNRGGIFQQDPQQISLPKHNHDFQFSENNTSLGKIKNAAWIYTTKEAGAGDYSTRDSYYDGYLVPKGTASAHAGRPNHTIKNTMVWDIPVGAGKCHGNINTTTGTAKTSSSEICPRHVAVNALIFIGRPCNI